MPKIKTTIGQLLVNEGLPPEFRDYSRVLDAEGTKALLNRVAVEAPEKYAKVAQHLLDVGAKVSTATGGYSFDLSDLAVPPYVKKRRDEIAQKLAGILSTRDDQKVKNQKIVDLMNSVQKPMEKEIYENELKRGNPLALQIASGSRGKPSNLKSLWGDGLYVDHVGNSVPIPIMKGFAEGLTPAEFFASTFGARAALYHTKKSVADAGYLSKRLTAAAHRLVTVADDYEDEDERREERGFPTTTDDQGNIGALFARAYGPYKRNDPITASALGKLREAGIHDILVRSPTVGGPATGVFSRDAGIREHGRLPYRGEFLGHAAAQAAGEKISQGGLGSKHSGGVAGTGQALTGYKAVDQLVETPETYIGGATHAKKDGVVSHIEDAPQGGKYVYIEGEEHYVPRHSKLSVKVGDSVEAGDTMTDGMPDPSAIVEHKGIGEGRHYFSHLLSKVMGESGMKLERRNAELIARGLIDHVRLHEEIGPHLPDDLVSYQALERHWEPREGYKTSAPHKLLDHYLEKPVLHYSIGTKIRPSTVTMLQKHGIKEISAHPEPPPFHPEMTRASAIMEHDEDWVAKHLGSNLQKSTLNAAHLGATSDPMGTSFVSAMALNPAGFGTEGATAGWKPEPSDKHLRI